MIKKIFLLSIIFFFCNCSDRKKSTVGEVTFSNKDLKVANLKSTEMYNVCDSVALSTKLMFISDKLILNEMRGRGLFHAIDIKSEKYIGLQGQIGSGPGELGISATLMKDGTDDFQIYDPQQKKIVVFDKKEMKFKKEYVLNKLLPSFCTFIMDGKLFSSSFVKSQHRLYISDLAGNLKDSIGTIAVEKEKKFSGNVFAQGHDVKIDYNNNIVALGYLTTPIIQIFDKQSKKWTVTAGPDNYKSFFYEKPENNSLGYTKETKVAYTDIKTTDKYIYALYSGMNLFDQFHYRCKNIYVFNLDGTPIARYELDKDIMSFDVDDDKIIYGLQMGEKSNKIFKFKI